MSGLCPRPVVRVLDLSKVNKRTIDELDPEDMANEELLDSRSPVEATAGRRRSAAA